MEALVRTSEAALASRASADGCVRLGSFPMLPGRISETFFPGVYGLYVGGAASGRSTVSFCGACAPACTASSQAGKVPLTWAPSEPLRWRHE
eukprot:scaffold295063_cov31-Tisochrysis_lutea.AAC.7